MTKSTIINRFKEFFGLKAPFIPAHLDISPGDTLLVQIKFDRCMKQQGIKEYCHLLRHTYGNAFPENNVVIIPVSSGIAVELTVLRKPEESHG